MKKISLFLILLLILPGYAKVSVALFPLKNQTDDRLLDWIGYSFPEFFFRKMSELSEVQVWDPVFLFSVDSLGWQLESDSLLMIHQNRWKWDVAIGGSYKADVDSVWITLKAVKHHRNKMISKKKEIHGETKFQLQNYSSLLQALLPVLDLKISLRDSINLKRVEIKGINVYATYAMGYGYEMREKINHAISAYSRVLEMDESFAPALYRIGMLYSRGRNRKEAQNYLDKAVSRSPNSSVVAAEMAEFMMRSDKPEKAISFIDSKRGLLERTSAGMKTIGMAYILTGEYQRAVSVLTRAVAAGPSDLETDFVLGRAYLYLGQFSTAGEIFGRLIKYRPMHTRYYTFLGEAYRESGRLMESCDVLEKAMHLDPDNVPNLINLANTYFKLGWYEKAEQYLLHAKDLNPALNEICINLGVLYWHMKRGNDARNMFNIAAEDEINVQSALNNQANILFLSGDIKGAIRAYKRAEKYGKKSEIIIYNLALAHLSAGKTKEAAAYLDEVLVLSPDRLDVIIMQARLASEQGQDKDAELYYRKILDLSPGQKEVMAKLIALFEKQERFKDAMQIVEGYLNNFPQDREYRLKLPDLYRKMGWYVVAIEEYQNMLKDKDYKDNSKVYLGLGISMFDIIRFKKGRNFEKAIYNLKIASQLDPDDPEPDIIIGLIYMDYKNYRELAMDHWVKAYKKSSDPQEKKKIEDLINGAKK